MYDAIDDPYCYPGTSVLRNRLHITDANKLSAFEVDAVTLRAQEPFPEGEIGPLLFRSFHHHLFQDVYDWAGELRMVRIHRDRSTFCYPEYIPGELDRLFTWLADQNCLTGMGASQFAMQGAHFLSELNAIHAFREGNGRTQMAFFAMLAARSGDPLELASIEPAAFLRAMIEAFGGSEEALGRQITLLIRP